MAKKNNGAQDQSSARRSGVLTNPIRNMIITALVSAALGVAFIVKPVLVYSYCGYIIGGLVGLIGLVYIIIYFARRPVSGVYRSEFAIGLMALLAGAYLAFSSQIPKTVGVMTMTFTLAALVRIIGIAIAADGILKLQYAIDLGRMKYHGWWFAFILSILGIALGVLVTLGLIYSMDGLLGLSGMMYLGIAFCLNGLLDLLTMIVVAVRNRKASKAEKAERAAAEAAAAAVPMAAPAPVPAPAPAVPAPAAEPVPSPTVDPAAPSAPDASAN